MNIEIISPAEIERRSMEIIESEMGDTSHLSESEKTIVKRVIHTTADFDYLKNLRFSENAVSDALEAIKNGAVFVTDTNMALAGINKSALNECGCKAYCFTADKDVAEKAKKTGKTRSCEAMKKAAEIFRTEKIIFAVGNAPTALIEIHEMIAENKISPALVIGVPVGFVNASESKELIVKDNVSYIAAMGRKGGSTVSAAVCNALLYMLYNRQEMCV